MVRSMKMLPCHDLLLHVPNGNCFHELPSAMMLKNVSIKQQRDEIQTQFCQIDFNI